MSYYNGRILPLILAGFSLSFTAAAAADDSVRWKDIDFGTCPLDGPLRVADSSSMANYISLAGCQAKIVVQPRSPIAQTPDVARIMGIKEERETAAGAKGKKRRGKGEIVAPPDGTRRIAYIADRPARFVGTVRNAPWMNPAYERNVRATAAAYRIDPLFLHAIIGTESTYTPTALSSAGARGLMQIMPATGARFGVTRGALYDPATNIDTGARLLKSLQHRYGNNFDLILAAYNAGEGAVERHGYAVPPYRETQDYVVKVMDRYAALRGAAVADGGI